MKLDELKEKKPVVGDYKKSNIISLTGKEVELVVYPLEIDSGYILIKRAFKKDNIAEHYTEIRDFLVVAGFTERTIQGGDSALFRSKQGLDIYFGKNGYDKTAGYVIKIQVRGGFCIYKGFRNFIRKITKDLRGILLGKNVITYEKFTRLDIATLIIADSIHDIVSDWQKTRILNISTMKPQKFFQYPDDPIKVNAISFTNSLYKLTVYDKELEINQKLKNEKCGIEYARYYQKYIDEAKRLGKKLFRYELKITADKEKLDIFSELFFNKPEKTDEALADIIRSFYHYHRFRQQPLKEDGTLGDTKRENTSKWVEDPVSQWVMLCHDSSNVIKVTKEEAKEKMGFNFMETQPKHIRELQEEIKIFAKKLVKHNRFPTTKDMKFIIEQLWLEFRENKAEVEKDIYDEFTRQKSFLLYQAETEKEEKLIESNFKRLIEEYKIQSNEAYYSSTMKKGQQRSFVMSEAPPDHCGDELVAMLTEA